MTPAQLAVLREEATAMAMLYLPKLALALFTLVVGWHLIRLIMKLVAKALSARHVDTTLAPFVNSIFGWGLKLMLLISVASMVGIQTTSFVAVLGAAGLAIGLALQGSLSNFAGGVLILIFRPFNVGDVIQAQGETGVVKAIQMFTTVLLNPQNRRVILPNGPLANGTIINFSAEPAVRVDTVVRISYDADVGRAREILLDMVKQLPGVLAEPAPVVVVLDLGETGVSIAVRPYCTPANHATVHALVVERTKKTLDEAGIAIPMPFRDLGGLANVPKRV